MLGWDVLVTRRSDEVSIASWTIGTGGLRWFDELVTQGLAAQLSGNGYPTSYVLAARHLLPLIRSAILPKESGPALLGDDYLGLGASATHLKLKPSINECTPDTELLVEAWDLS